MEQRTLAAERTGHPHKRVWLALFAVAVLAVALFASRSRWWPQPAWDANAIAAHFVDVTVEKGERDVHVVFHYALTNSTGQVYRMPPPSVGVLMAHMPEGGLHAMDSVVWEPTAIPAGKTVNAEFDVALDPLTAEPYPDLSADELHERGALNDFARRHLARMRGLVFMDYQKRYSIELPQGWQ